MNIATTLLGHTYIGFSDLMTSEELSRYIVFNDLNAIADSIEKIVAERAKQLGGKKYRGKYFGPGFIFPNETESSLKEKVIKMFPYLCT